MVDLKKFCGTELSRLYLHEPFSRGEYTYATDGTIIVRVTRVAGIAEVPTAPNPERIFAAMGAPGWHPLRVDLPTPAPPEECTSCYDGYEHNCPDCTCECKECSGTGEIDAMVSTELTASADTSLRVIFDLKYIRMVAELPGVEVAITDGKSPSFFRFDGGDGAIMPMRSEFKNHVKVEVE